MQKFEVTVDQAAAFVEALVGMEAINQSEDPCGGYNSPAAAHHLHAVLGMGNLPSVSAVYQCGGDPTNSRTLLARERVGRFCDYVEAVASTLRFRMADRPAEAQDAEA